MKKHLWLIALIVVAIAAISYTDLGIRPGYWTKTMVKAPIFFLVPILYTKIDGDFHPFTLLKWNKSGIKTGFILGIGIYIIVVGFYLLASKLVDLSGIEASLDGNLGIDESNFLIIGLYVSVVNSFLEEWFFRGFIFRGVQKSSRKFAYVLSSLAFSIYHIAMMDGMFHIGVLALVLLGLFVGGTIFNYLNEKNNTIYASWFCHSFANFAMNTIGVMIFLLGTEKNLV